MGITLADVLAVKFKTAKVEIDGLGTAYVRELSYADRVAFFKAWNDEGADDAAILVASTFCDEGGKLLVTTQDVQGFPNSIAIQLYDAATALNFPKVEEPVDPKSGESAQQTS